METKIKQSVEQVKALASAMYMALAARHSVGNFAHLMRSMIPTVEKLYQSRLSPEMALAALNRVRQFDPERNQPGFAEAAVTFDALFQALYDLRRSAPNALVWARESVRLAHYVVLCRDSGLSAAEMLVEIERTGATVAEEQRVKHTNPQSDEVLSHPWF